MPRHHLTPRQRRIIATVECPTCDVAAGHPCRLLPADRAAGNRRIRVHLDRATAYGMLGSGDIIDHADGALANNRRWRLAPKDTR